MIRTAVTLAAAAAALAAGGGGAVQAATAVRTPAAAALEGCVTAIPQAERSATFSGEMTAVPGTARMLMRIELQERAASETTFHAVSFPGLGVWLRAIAGVHTFKNVQRVTDLSAPAVYRAAIRFRWIGARGRVLRTQELRSARCVQPEPPSALPGARSTVTAGGTGAS